jgi:UDP-N-acetyl-D-galactosamine dehydrogenase
LAQIIKIVSADDDETLDQLAVLYASIVEAGVHRVSSIRVAEAAKVIENTQRDLNIALVNELAMIFDRLDIDSNEVFKAAETKWNFHRFRPGLVGGHCIGVDPYYLTHKAQSIGYDSRVILAGRRINDEMAEYVAEKTMTELRNAGVALSGAVVTVLGVTFKENCADTRNSQVFKLIATLESNGINVQVVDPLVNLVEVEQQHHIDLQSLGGIKAADGLVVAVAHEVFLQNPTTLVQQLLKPSGVLIDIKSAFTSAVISDDSQRYWSL